MLLLHLTDLGENAEIKIDCKFAQREPGGINLFLGREVLAQLQQVLGAGHSSVFLVT